MTLWNKQDGLVLNHTAAARKGRGGAVADGRLDDEGGGDSGAIDEEEEEEEGTRKEPDCSRKAEFSGRALPPARARLRLAWHPRPPSSPIPAGFIMGYLLQTPTKTTTTEDPSSHSSPPPIIVE